MSFTTLVISPILWFVVFLSKANLVLTTQNGNVRIWATTPARIEINAVVQEFG